MTRNNTTTDLDVVRKRASKFTWGEVVKIHDIGRYTIIEYISRDLGDGKHLTFHIYVDGESLSVGTSSLEEALVYGVAYHFADNDPNRARHAAWAAMKVLK